jgi:predicted dehydrogenase
MVGGDPDSKIDRIKAEYEKYVKELEKAKNPAEIALLQRKVNQQQAWMQDIVDAARFGYVEKTIGNRTISAMEELVRWRLFDRTSAGLMGELGSHQLDAATIFCSALRKDGKKARPLTVHAVGGRHIFLPDRDADDHVYCMFEFPGPEYDDRFDIGYKLPGGAKGLPGYEQDPNKKVVVTYSSINGNTYGGYGEVVLGTKGTLILEKEQDVFLYPKGDTGAAAGVKAAGSGYALDTQASGGTSAPVSKASASAGPVSRGYTEEIEHWAYCIRNNAPENKPRCYPEVAMADAVIALTTNVALRKSARGEAGFVRFDDAWFDVDNDATPDGSSVADEMQRLKDYTIHS